MQGLAFQLKSLGLWYFEARYFNFPSVVITTINKLFFYILIHFFVFIHLHANKCFNTKASGIYKSTLHPTVLCVIKHSSPEAFRVTQFL